MIESGVTPMSARCPVNTPITIAIYSLLISIFSLPGLTVMLSDMAAHENDSAADSAAQPAYSNPLIGVLLILLGALVQSLQYAFEEKVMTGGWWSVRVCGSFYCRWRSQQCQSLYV